MKFLPFDRFDLVSPLERPALIARLQRLIAPPSLIRFSKPNEPYIGAVSEDGFRLSPVIGYRNSFKPVIVGKFLPYYSGVRISVVQRPHLLVLAFMAVWFGGVIIMGGAVALFGDVELQARLIPAGMLLFGWALVVGGFWWEARHTREDLMQNLDATEYHP